MNNITTSIVDASIYMVVGLDLVVMEDNNCGNISLNVLHSRRKCLVCASRQAIEIVKLDVEYF